MDQTESTGERRDLLDEDFCLLQDIRGRIGFRTQFESEVSELCSESRDGSFCSALVNLVTIHSGENGVFDLF